MLVCCTFKIINAAPTRIAPVPSNTSSAPASVNIQCDSISNYQRGRKYCIIKGVRSDENTTFTYEPSFFAVFKTEMLFDSCDLHSIPPAIFVEFPNLKTLYTWNSALVVVSKTDFHNALLLKELDLSYNRISELLDSTFFWAIDLEIIKLEKNRLNRLEKLAFHGLINLRTLSLAHNQLEVLAPGTFDVMPRLRILYLQKNRVRIIDVKLFARNTELREIQMQDNHIVQLSGSTFAHLHKLNHFDIHDNPIVGLDHIVVDSIYTNIRNISCGGAYIGIRTEKLLASHNRIEYVIVESASKNVVELDLAVNRLVAFANLTELLNLRELDISDNQITDIGLNSFASMTKLVDLRLKNSGLSMVDFGLFSHKPKLKVLDISFNRLGEIDLNMFTALPNVRSLYLEGNSIVEMDMSGIRNFFPLLSKIGISKNSWNCMNLAMAVKVLESNHIELNAVGLTKHTTNIKGIPCRNVVRAPAMTEISSIPWWNAISKSLPTAEAKLEDFLSLTPQMLQIRSTMGSIPTDSTKMVTATTHVLTAAAVEEKCVAETASPSDIETVVRMVALKLEINDVMEAMTAIQQKIQLILDTVAY